MNRPVVPREALVNLHADLSRKSMRLLTMFDNIFISGEKDRLENHLTSPVYLSKEW